MRSDFETLEQYQDSMKKFNENTRMGFEKFIQSHGSDRNKLQLRCTPYTDKKGGYGSFDLDFGLSVYQHQQSKVDELQKRLDASLIAFEKLNEEINQLHGQCDLHLIKYLEEKVQVLEQALKGGCDASN
ncbi:hypothetical protein F4U02_13320 [Acinetobacter haemolyticus]|uniref:hypothetical protein n=1 Tax=Acinetobacter haemolyticus TaxID=29430 RepID=UPI001298814C|nr:hypothetical protein [Acinetobacter haemolyticus]MQZ31965.1 hypothetical protein [Acinetobacter haemolyticus]